MKAVALAILALMAQSEQRAKDFFDRIEFGPSSPDGEAERKALEALSRREQWIGAFRTIEEKCGAFPDNLMVKVDFTLQGGEAGWGAGRGSEGQIRFNLKVLGNIQRKIDDLEVKSKEAQSRGGKLIYKVPPAKIERVVYHELTHVLQGDTKAPDWFLEGMAQYVADDPNNIYGFAVANKTIQEIDSGTTDRVDVYARGHLFWKWLEWKGIAKKVVDLTVFHRKEYRDALEEATGFNWSVVVSTERDWSAGELQKYKPK